MLPYHIYDVDTWKSNCATHPTTDVSNTQTHTVYSGMYLCIFSRAETGVFLLVSRLSYCIIAQSRLIIIINNATILVAIAQI